MNGDGEANQLVKDNPRLFEDIGSAPAMAKDHSHRVLNIPSQPNLPDEQIEEIQDITHETEDESLSIEKKEKELIIRALKKNHNKRKYAARDLGISERTLYRKIKQYELEE